MKKIPIKCKGQKYLPYTELNEFQGNLKKITQKDLEKLKNQIKKLGWVAPIFIWVNGDKNEIIDGHGRLKALKSLIEEGYTIDDLPVVEIEAKSRKEAAEILLSINSVYQKMTEKGLYEFLDDMELDLNSLENLNLPNIDISELKELFAAENEGKLEEDELPEIAEDKAETKYGDIYMLGNHRLMCGDSFSEKDVRLLMDGKRANMIYTDPPYGMNLDTDFSSMDEGKKYRKIINDDKDYDPSHIFKLFGYCKEIFLWGADYYADKLPKRNDGCWIVWDKTECGLSPNSEYEKMYGNNFELCWSKTKHKRAIVRVLWKGIFGLYAEDTKKRLHPTQKPIRLAEWFIEQFSKKNDIVVDLFLGSGSTLIACEKTGRICYAMEIDPIYCDLVITRYVKFTGNKNIIKNGEPITWQW